MSNSSDLSIMVHGKTPRTPAGKLIRIAPTPTGALAYAAYAGARKPLFNCPAATATDPDLADNGFAAGDVYCCYGLNAYAGADSGFIDLTRTSLFNEPNICALFARNSANVWIGRKITVWRRPSSPHHRPGRL